MTQRKPVKLSSNLTRIDTSTPTPAPSSKNGGWLVVAAIVGVLFLIAKCSTPSSGPSAISPAEEEVGNAQQALAAAVSAQPSIPVEPLSRKAVKRGATRVAIAGQESLAGEMIYSQNCYDAVGRKFSWKKLDECGGFDMEASATLGDEQPTGSDKGVAWFDSEVAADRYLKAATSAGLAADDADQRLAGLQSQIAARHRSGNTPTPAADPSGEPVAPVDQGGSEEEIMMGNA